MSKRLALAFGIALLAAAAWFSAPRLMTLLQQRRQNLTMADMRHLGTVLEVLMTERKSLTMGPVRRVPAGTLHRVAYADLVRALSAYTSKVPRLDRWGEPIGVYVGNYDEQGRARDYLVRTFGSDRRADTSRYTRGKTSRFSQDVVFANGYFFRHPEWM